MTTNCELPEQKKSCLLDDDRRASILLIWLRCMDVAFNIFKQIQLNAIHVARSRLGRFGSSLEGKAGSPVANQSPFLTVPELVCRRPQRAGHYMMTTEE